jgi:hypothetical protein
MQWKKHTVVILVLAKTKRNKQQQKKGAEALRTKRKDYNLFVGCVEWNIYGSQRKIGAVMNIFLNKSLSHDDNNHNSNHHNYIFSSSEIIFSLFFSLCWNILCFFSIQFYNTIIYIYIYICV